MNLEHPQPQHHGESPKPLRGGFAGEATRAYMTNPTPPPGGSPLQQGIEQIADTRIGAHKTTDPHVTEQRVRELANEQHDAATHTDLAKRGEVDALSQRVLKVEQAQQQPQAGPLSPQDVTVAIRQDAQAVAAALQPHLPIGGGTGFTEAQIRQMADEQIDAAGVVDDADVEQIITDKVTDGALAAGAAVTAIGDRVTAIEGRLPVGNEPLITEAEVVHRLGVVQNAIPQNIVTTDILHQRLPPPTTGQRMLALLGNRRARAYVNYYDANAPGIAPAPPANPAHPNTDVFGRRALLVGGGVGLAALGIGGMWWLIAHSQPQPYIPSGTTPGSGNTPPEYTPSGQDYDQMSPQKAEQIIKLIDASYPHQTGPTINTDIDANHVGIATGWEVAFNGNTYVKGDTAAFKNNAQVTISDGMWRVVPSAVARDAFVAIVVYTKALGQDMSNTQPLPEWNLPPYGS